jgi:hypothetical protein
MATWLENRPELRPRTRELYGVLLRLHIGPDLGGCRFGSLTTAEVRAWHAALLRKGKPGPVTVAKAYRLLRCILNDAVEDGPLVRMHDPRGRRRALTGAPRGQHRRGVPAGRCDRAPLPAYGATGDVLRSAAGRAARPCDESGWTCCLDG